MKTTRRRTGSTPGPEIRSRSVTGPGRSHVREEPPFWSGCDRAFSVFVARREDITDAFCLTG
jgi:hypothetical protein